MLLNIKEGFRSIRAKFKTIRDEWKFPYLRVKSEPANRPSIESIYFRINQLGKHAPIGLTHNTSVGYHELPFPELKFKVSRNDLTKRIDRIVKSFDVRGRYGVDLGCAIGGITFALQKSGAQMLGIDRDSASLNVAQECEALFKTGAKFANSSITTDACSQLLSRTCNPKTGRWDFIVWFSSFNWVAKDLGVEGTKSLLSKLSEMTDVLIMDSAIGGKAQADMEMLGAGTNEEFEQFILSNSTFTSAKIIGIDSDWYGRAVFMFARLEFKGG